MTHLRDMLLRPTMPRVNPSHFFDKVRRWQWIKHTILTDYLYVWARKVGSQYKRIHIVDAFAGAGTYTDDSGGLVAGSPVLEAGIASRYRREFPGRSMSLTCIERNTANFHRLETTMAAQKEDVYLRRGDFIRYETEILNRLGRDPALVLLDPIGLKAITADRCKRFLERPGKTDLFVIVDFGIMHRAAGHLHRNGTARNDIAGAARLAETLDRFMGGDAWRAIAVNDTLDQEVKEGHYIDLYFSSVLANRFRYKCAYEVRDGYQGPIQYWLVVASNHFDAVWLLNDAIVKVDHQLYAAEFEEPDTLPGLSAVKVYADSVEDELQKAILRRVDSAGGRIAFDRLRMELLLDGFFGRVKSGDYSRAVKHLIKTGKLSRQNPRLAAKLEPAEPISVPRLHEPEETTVSQLA